MGPSGAFLASLLMPFGRPWQPIRQKRIMENHVFVAFVCQIAISTFFNGLLDGFVDLLGLSFRLFSK